MKHLFAALLAAMPFALCAQLNGNYTINPVGGNYATIGAAVTALNTVGVSGPVTFAIAPGTYAEKLVFGTIAGVSATNTVLFRSSTNVASDVNIGPAPDGTHTIDLGTTRRVNFQYLTIQAAAKGVVGSYPRNCDFLDCNITGLSNGTTTHGFDIARTERMKVHRCTVANVDHAAWLGAINGALASLNLEVMSCTVDARCEGIRVTAVQDLWLQYNTVAVEGSCTSYGSGIEMSGNTGVVRVTGNRVTADANASCLQVANQAGTANQRARVVNNMLICTADGALPIAIGMSNTSYIDVYHNSILVTNGFANAVASYSSGNLRFRGNIVKMNDDGLYYYMETPTGPFTFNHNMYHAANGGLFALGGNFYGFAAWQTAGYDASGLEQDPLFTSNTDLHLTNASPAQNKVPLNLGVSEDIDQNGRPSPVFTIADMGCDERTQFLQPPLAPQQHTDAAATTPQQFYPNPVSDKLYASGLGDEAIPFTLCTADGRVAMNGTVAERSPIDLSGLGNGTYLLVLADRAAPWRIVVQH